MAFVLFLDRIGQRSHADVVHADDLAAFFFDQLADRFVKFVDLIAVRFRIDDIHYFVCSICQFHFLLLAFEPRPLVSKQEGFVS